MSKKHVQENKNMTNATQEKEVHKYLNLDTLSFWIKVYK